jgi:ABC-type polysaccharide transport system permease subunit
MLNEVTAGWFKKTAQTITFMPFFLSWVILSGILMDVFSPREGVVNQLLGLFGVRPIYFFGDPSIFQRDGGMANIRFCEPRDSFTNPCVSRFGNDNVSRFDIAHH